MEGKYFPLDLLMIILTYLPIKSLIRFKSVSKSWKTIIEDHGFIEAWHQIQATNKKDNYILIRDYDSFSLLHRSETGVVKRVNLVLPIFKDKNMENMESSAPCNGILCMSDGDKDIALWNPAIQEFKLLPRIPNQPQPNEALGLRNFSIGFGFDHVSRNYKVIRIQAYDFDHLSRTRIVKANMYSLNSDSWRSIVSIPEISFKKFPFGEVYLDGKYFWCLEQDSDVYKILYFDMVKEVFEVIDLPDSSSTDTESWDKLVVVGDFEFEVIDLPTGNGRSYWSSLMLMNDSLAMVSYIYSESQLYLHIWRLKENGGLRSWYKLLTIGPFHDYDTPFGFWKDEILFKLERPGKLISYDNTTREAKKILENDNLYYSYPVGVYNESLVSIKSRGMPVITG